MGYREDIVNAVRRSAIPQLHYLLDGTFGAYAVSHTTADEYVMTAHCDEDTIEAVLADIGFSRNPIASLKVRMDGNTSEGSWVWRPSPLSSWQLHIVLHQLEETDEDCVDVYAHWECSWIRHPYNHYTARGYDAEKGVELAKRWLEGYDGDAIESDELAYETDTSIYRRLSETFSLSYYQLKEHSMAVRSRLPLIDATGDVSLTHSEDDGRSGVSPRITDRF
ncbi:hypothetical protein OB955_23250 [Halobacteria archaeon AArc-m2/3/4]|uniref:Uncharacterized protein n=1 Tax=Natronoglomus mannanivorans TaxID=2979990 RepID=A0AAP3E020_9EURY|nr:hypothetical protein [Halobacteria archaeon AArc-xg1-1]MCU4975607.1 hypothetical protein [Halobacteria archaeon AArc-m2/3/4]